MFSGSVTATRRQRHCSSRNVRRKRCCGGNTDGAATSNRAKPYSEFLKICQTVPIVRSVIPTVPGGGSEFTVTGQPIPKSSDRASGEISLCTIGLAIPKALAGTVCPRGRELLLLCRAYGSLP